MKQTQKHFDSYGINVSRETLGRLGLYADLLREWQKSINLVSNKSLDVLWERHFLDSAQIVNFIPERPGVVYDLGSGAGFPGMVLAIMRPDLEVTLVESDQKKCAFLGAVSRETNTRIVIENERIEVLSESLIAPDFITARALAPLPLLLDYVLPWAKKNIDMQMFFLKGGAVDLEVDEAKGRYGFKYKKTCSKSSDTGFVLKISGLVDCCE